MSEPLAAGTQLGPYEIVGMIGAGGMGQVYRARDPRLGRHVAIKTLLGSGADAEGVRRFETEARAAGTLDHPNLLVVYDVGRDRGVSYIVSELLEGETLRQRLRSGPVPEGQAIEYAAQIARGLAAAHERGIVHRDLKPENLLLTRDRGVKILDFGVAKLIHTAESDSPTAVVDTVTAPGIVVGTAGYMAPEQVRGQPIDHRADIFSLGVVLHEMLSGARPFQRDTAPETLTAILNDEPPALPPHVSPALARVVCRCLDKRREDRFHSAHDLGLGLELLSAMTPSGHTLTEHRPAASVPRRRALLYGAASLAVIASGLGGALLERRFSPAVVAPSFRRLTFRRGLIRSARLAPDGRTILYSALWDGERCRVHTASVDSPESRPLDLPDGNVLAISRTGEVALALGPHFDGVVTYGTLARVPITGGAPRQMIEDVKFADWSPDGTDLAVVRRVDGLDRLEFPIGTILVQPTAGNGTGLGFPRIAPDGKRVAFVQYRTPGSLVGKIAIVDQAGVVTSLSDEYLNVHGLAWNGDEIWYAAADTQLFRALCAVTPGGARRTITRMPGNPTLWDAAADGRLVIAHTDDRAVVIARRPEDIVERDLSWLDASWVADLSHDGRLVLFTETGQGAGPTMAVYLRGTDGSHAVRLGSGRAIALSPDTRWAICAPAGDPSSPSPYLELLPTGAGEARRLTAKDMFYTGAAWLPDGKRLIVSAIEPDHGARLYVQDVAQGPPAPITPEGVTAWVVSPDGSTIAARGPTPEIRLYPVDGTASRELAGVTRLDRPIGWIRDGLLIRPGDTAASRGEIRRVDMRMGRQEAWMNILPRDPAGIMVLVSFCVTPDGRSVAYSWHRALTNLYVTEGLA
jgi:tRNA A-37 threonylcarbamoyl transferase component Bud32